MEICFAQLGPSHSSLPQMGLKYSKALDLMCWRGNMAGDSFGSYTTSNPWCSASCSSAMKPIMVGKSSQTSCCADDTNRGKGFTNGKLCSIRHRRSHSYHQRDRATSGMTKVRSFVDEATAHSADVELSSSSPPAVSERGDGQEGGPDLDSGEEFRESDDDEAMPERQPSASRVNGSLLNQKLYADEDGSSEEDGEFGPGIKIIEAESPPSVDRDYEDMKLGEKRNWSIADMTKIDMLRDFDYRQGSEKGVFVVQAMRVEHMKATEDLLVDSFAELMGGLLTYRPLLALTVKQYIRDRYACLPDAVTLVGLYAPAEENGVMEMTENEFSGNWLLAGTLELSFTNVGHPDIPAGPAPPPGSPYLCNMAVSSNYRRRGLGRQLLKAAEELALLMGAQDLYLHCRMVDTAPLNMYQGAGYQIIATDSILSFLSFQRRRYLMRKRLQAPTPLSTIS